jgi:hypothetical protein
MVGESPEEGRDLRRIEAAAEERADVVETD